MVSRGLLSAWERMLWFLVLNFYSVPNLFSNSRISRSSHLHLIQSILLEFKLLAGFRAHWFRRFPLRGFFRFWSYFVSICFVSNWSVLHLWWHLWCFDQACIKLTSGVLLMFVDTSILVIASRHGHLRIIQWLWKSPIIYWELIHLIISIMSCINNLTLQPTIVNQHRSICLLSPFNLFSVKLRYTFEILNLIQNWFFNLLKILHHLSNLGSTHFA